MADKTLHEKMVELQSEIKVKKDLFNKFGGFHYRSLESILGELKPLLKKHNLFINFTEKIELLDEDLILTSSGMLLDEEGNHLSSQSSVLMQKTKKGMDTFQLSGTGTSYARKYALQGLLGLDDGIDSDSPEIHENKEGKKSNESKLIADIKKRNGKYLITFKDGTDKEIEQDDTEKVKQMFDCYKKGNAFVG